MSNFEPNVPSSINSRIGNKSVRGSALTLFAQFTKFALQIGTTAVLARFLTPDDFGIYGMAAVVIMFSGMLQDLGLTMAIVQRKEVLHQELSNLFWTNVGFSSFLGLLVFAASWPISAFYGRIELRSLISLLALSVVAQGSLSVFRAILQRNMEFKKMVSVEITAMVLASGVAVTLAIRGAGYQAFLGQTLTVAFTGLVGYWLMSAFVPKGIDRRVSIRGYLKYGLNHAGFRIVNFFARQGDNVIIGKWSGPEALGYYANAYRLLMLPLQQIAGPLNQALLPALSRFQDEPVRFRSAYNRCLRVLSRITIPIVVVMAVNAYQIVAVVLGPGWERSAYLFLCLFPAALIGSTNMGTGWVYMAIGHTNRQFRWGIFNSIATVSAMVIGYHFAKVPGVAIGISTVFVALRLPGILYCFKGTPLTLMDFLKPHSLPAIAAILGAVSVLFFRETFVLDYGIFIDLILGVGIFMLTYLLILFSQRPERALLLELVKKLKK